MINFITIVAAIVVAHFITFAIGYALLMNEKFVTMYMKKTMKIVEKVQEEALDEWLNEEG